MYTFLKGVVIALAVTGTTLSIAIPANAEVGVRIGGVAIGVNTDHRDYYDGYYDGYYGPYNDGYWGDDNAYYYADGKNVWHRDDGHHFQRGEGKGFNHVHGKGGPRQH